MLVKGSLAMLFAAQIALKLLNMTMSLTAGEKHTVLEILCPNQRQRFLPLSKSLLSVKRIIYCISVKCNRVVPFFVCLTQLSLGLERQLMIF